MLAEAIGAGKLVISDPDTAATFGGGVISALPEEVDDIIRRYIERPGDYVAHVQKAQSNLGAFSPDSFLKLQGSIFGLEQDAAA